MRVHEIERHLRRVKMKALFLGDFQHAQVNQWVLVAGEADEADFPRLLGRQHRLHGAARRKNAVRILHADDLVKLHQINMIGL